MTIERNAASDIVYTGRPGPRLRALLKTGSVYVTDDGAIVGIAIDGEHFQLGQSRCSLDALEEYLAEYPTPADW